MYISTVNRFSFLGFIILLSLWSLVVSQILDIHKEQTVKNQEYHFRSYNIANKLRQSSDDLTRMARTYVSTGDPIYEQYYFNILAIRNGEAPRPINYPLTYWYTFLASDSDSLNNLGKPIPLQSLMHEMGFREQEFSLLRESQNRSDRLVRLEMQAFAAMKGLFDDGTGHFTVRGKPDSAFARRLLFGPQYHQEKVSIMQPIQKFLDEVEYRMTSESRILQARQTKLLWLAILLIIISTLMAIIIAIYVREKIIFPIFSLDQEAQMIAEGNYQARCEIQVENEIGSLGHSLNEMAECIEMDLSKLQKMASIDDLVGISNRRTFMNILELEVERARRYGSPLSLLMMDVDSFKSFNDIYGHLIGDEILKLVCNVSQIGLRENDLMGRVGGEEFSFILPATNIDSAILVAERIRMAIEKAILKCDSNDLHVTVSIGTTQFVKGDSNEGFLKRADMAMYKSKENGRNQTSWY